MRKKTRRTFWFFSVILILAVVLVGCIAEDFFLPVRLTGKAVRMDSDPFFAFSEYCLTLTLRGKATSVDIFEGDQLLDTVPAKPEIHYWPLVTDIDCQSITLIARDHQGKSLWEVSVPLESRTNWLRTLSSQDSRAAENAGLYYITGNVWLFYSFPYMGSKSGAYRREIRNAVQSLPAQEVWVLVPIEGTPWVCPLESFRENPGNVIPLEDVQPTDAFPKRAVDFSRTHWLDPAIPEWLDPAEMDHATAISDGQGLWITLSYTQPLMASLAFLDPTQFRLSQADESVLPNAIQSGDPDTQLILHFNPLPPGGPDALTIVYTQSADEENRLKDFSNLVDVKSDDDQPVAIQQKFTLTLNASPTQGGAVFGDGEYDAGEQVVITATPNEGYRFIHWRANGTVISDQAIHTYPMPSENVNLVANFQQITPDTYTLTLEAAPPEGGTVTGTGIYEEGEEVQITATSNEGYFFVNWTGNGEVVRPDAQHIYMVPPQNTTLVANFALTPDMVQVQNGVFQMGDEVGDLWWTTRPVHSVTLTYDYWIGKFLVTFEQYDIFCEATGRSKPGDEGWGRGLNPVIHVSWWDVIAYCNWLSERNGLAVAYDSDGKLLNRDGEITEDIRQVEGYRLPTEAEWEYAASGGHQALPIPPRFRYAGSDNIDDVAWYGGNSGGRTHTVGGKQANPLGLYDMSGNVWEWCHDWYGNYSSSAKTDPIGPSSASNRIMRGSTWSQHSLDWCRVAYRTSSSPNTRNSGLGFRLSRTDGIDKAMITVESSPTAAGDVRVNSGDWSTHQQANLDIGSQVTVEARANEGYEWEGWYEGNTKASDQAVYVFDAPDQNRSLKASFQEAIPGEPVTIRSKAFPNFGGWVGIDDHDLSEEFEEEIPGGQSVILRAQPHEGWVFMGWWEAGLDDHQPLGTEETWVYQPDGDIDLIALFDPNIDGQTEWDFQATLTLSSPVLLVYETSGSGTVTITQGPVRMIGSATFPAPDLSSISEASVRSILAYGLRRTLAKAFPALAPVPSRERVNIPPENTIHIRGPENGEFTMDYDVTFHDFDPEDPYDSSVTLALARFGVDDEYIYIVVEIDPIRLDPQEVEFRVNLLSITNEEQEEQEEITGYLDCIVSLRL